MVGVNSFGFQDTCVADGPMQLTDVAIKDSIFEENLSIEYGGAIAIESGNVQINRVRFLGNIAGIPGKRRGRGGAIYLTGRCSGSSCAPSTCKLRDSELINNMANIAGGGLYMSSMIPMGGGLMMENSKVIGNLVGGEFPNGLGGGVFLEGKNFTLNQLQVANNTAHLGGGLFIDTNVDENSRLRNVFTAYNNGESGSHLYWKRGASPEYALETSGIQTLPLSGSLISTEALQVAFDIDPQTMVQSSEEMDPFSVQLLDFYGAVSATHVGECSIKAVPAQNSSEAVVRPLGSNIPTIDGRATFSQVQLTGQIGVEYTMRIQCVSEVMDLSGAITLQYLSALDFQVIMAACDPGYSPAATNDGDICVPCRFGTFNLDGEECNTCPEGAVCSGGDRITSDSNWWRSSNDTLNFYQCRYPDVCLAGTETGDRACAEGHKGPLCAVCEDNWFSFAGRCRECDKSGRSKLMLSFSAIGVGIILILIFARSWDFGNPGAPGLLTKLKILLIHFQLISLFKEYDILWPSSTSEGFAWFGIIDVGPAMLAPQCLIGPDYNYWASWIAQMSLPVAILILCLGIYKITCAVLENRQNQANENNPELNDKFSTWLESLKMRCWKNSFWLITLIYPASCFVALEMFGLQKIEEDTYLTADFSIIVKEGNGGFTGTYIRYMIPGAIILALLSIGVPLFCFLAIRHNRFKLDEPTTATKFGFLYAAYKRSYPYWETVQMLRRFSFAFIPVFIRPNAKGSVQGSVAQLFSIILLVATVWIKPYANDSDNYLDISSQIGTTIVLLHNGCLKCSNSNLVLMHMVQCCGLFYCLVLLLHGQSPAPQQ